MNQSSFPFHGWIFFYLWISHNLFSHLPVRYICVVFTFWLVWITTVNMHYTFLCDHVFISLGCMPWNRIAGSYVNFTFKFLRNWLFCTVLHYFILPLEIYDGYNFPHPLQHLLLSISLIIEIPVDVKWYLIVLIYISLKTNVEHLFIWL